MNDNNFVKLGDVAHECRLTWSGEQTNIPIVGLEHLIPGEIELSSWDSNIEHTFSKKFTKGQVLLGRRRVYLKKAVVAPCDGICSGDITVIESTGGILPELLPFVIQNDRFFDYAMQGSAGSLSPRVKWEHLKNYEFSLPPLAEQKVLADKLWAAYRLKESYKKLLTATEEMVKSQFIEMFGDPLKNPKNYTQRKLGDVATLLNGRAYKASELLSSGRYLVLRVGNFFTNTDYYYSDLELEPDKYCDTGDILYSWSATLGAQIWKGGKVIYHYHIWKVLFDENILNKEYFCFMLNVMTDSLKQETHGSTMVHLTKDGMEKKFIAIPPLELQRRFVSIAEQADKSGFDELKSQFIEMFDFHELNLNSPSKDFESMCLDDTSSATKIPAAEYLQEGKYAVYDQAQEKDIAGYSNTEQGLCRNYPAVLFGDHSRVVKYINEPFFIGADGVKIIRPREENLIPEFLYYDLKYHNIPNTGYNRHFKYIKMISLTKASLEEQSQFLSIAHQADKSGSVLQYMIAC